MRNWQKRALRTFIQSAAGTLFGLLAAVNWSDLSAVKGALVGIIITSVASGFAAVQNYLDEKNDW